MVLGFFAGFGGCFVVVVVVVVLVCLLFICLLLVCSFYGFFVLFLFLFCFFVSERFRRATHRFPINPLPSP